MFFHSHVFSASSSEYLQQDSNHSDTLSIYALPKNSPNRSSAQSRLSVNPEKEKEDKNITISTITSILTARTMNKVAILNS